LEIEESHRQQEIRAKRLGLFGTRGTFTTTGPNVLHIGGLGPPAANTTTKAELLSRARVAIEAGERSLYEAAEALGIAQEDHSATQREMAAAVGKSVAWVNALLQWRLSGYKDESPFGPTTKAGRIQHAEQRAKHRNPRNAATQRNADVGAELSAVEGKTEHANKEAEATAPSIEIPASQKPSPTEAKSNLISAIDRWWRYLDGASKREVIDHFLDTVDVWV
jgi:hypothetical protein